MSVTLVVEHAPHRQPASRRTVEAGELVIGRGADADWRIEDPDMYVSRTHCVVSVTRDGAVVRDASRGGLFVDGASKPLGPGNSAPLEHGTRLRLGDVLLRVEIDAASEAAPEAAGDAPAGGARFTWADPSPPVEASERPGALPEPFDGRAPKAEPAADGRGFAFDDPFTLDAPLSPQRPPASGETPWDSSRYFDSPEAPGPSEASGPAEARPSERERRRGDDPFAWPPSTPQDAGLEASDPADDKWSGEPRAPDEAEPPRLPERVVERRPPPERGNPSPASDPPGAPIPMRPTAPLPTSDPPAAPVEARRNPTSPVPSGEGPRAAEGSDPRAAFFRGLGLDPGRPEDAEAEMEAMGARFRLLAEGLTELLRARAQEKRSVRVAQTVIGSAEVNPLKFTASTDEAVSALVARRGQGYLPPDAAIEASFRDLRDHQLRTWTALQAALRRMIDRFDPEAIEREMQDTGLIEALLAGGRGAKLWRLYQERYREIARAAEDRFLGEVGAEFRDAYEGRDHEGRET